MTTKIPKSTHVKMPITYRELRFNWTVATTIVLFVMGQFFLPLLALFSHMIATVFWDLWFYTIKGVKESSRLPKEFFEERQITKYQVDRYIKFSVKTKRIFFAASMIGFGAGIILKDVDLMLSGVGVFYIGWSITIGLALIVGYIQQPYPIRFRSAPYNYHNFGETGSDSNSSIKWDDPHNASHPLSYNNPISINYIGS